MDSHSVRFKVDTGAAVTAVPSNLAKYFDHVGPSSKSLRGAGNHRLKIDGSAVVKLKVRDRIVTDTLYLVDGLVEPLLGKPAIAKLELLKFVGELAECSGFGWFAQFPKLFEGLGSMESEVRITLERGVAPFAQSVPRRVAAARKKPLREELSRMERLGVISKIEEPTDWCAPIVVVPKKNGKIRVCIDFTRLNEAVKRELHPLPTTEETLSELGKAKVFSKLDANCGYWQMKLKAESQKLTTFITPFGRYFCRRLPFGISSAPEIFQREMQKALMDLPGVVCQMDDVLVYGSCQKEHDERLGAALKRLMKAGITLNKEKCAFSKDSVKFLGHVIDASGIHADPDKTKSIREFPTPGNRKELRRFFGIVNYLGKFSASLSSASVALRQLLGKECDWVWGPAHQAEFEQLKDIMSSTPTLIPFDLECETMLSTDASSYGLGAALLQRVGEVWMPVAYASRTMTATEQRYAQIEKEALAICWGCSKFDYYLSGRRFRVETDHKPLVSVLGSKELAQLPLRVQRFRLRMMNYSYTIGYTPGHKLVLADALSRAPLETTGCEQDVGRDSVESSMVAELVTSLPISPARGDRIRAAMLEDSVGLSLVRHIENGWPCPKNMDDTLKPYFTFRDYLTTIQGLVFYNDRLFIPELERDRVLSDVHRGHQGETKCVQRAVEVAWWPGMTKDIREVVRGCGVCEEHRKKHREPLLLTALPERPWWRLATDLFQKDGRNYLVLVDYYSRYICVEELAESTESSTVIQKLEKVFCLLGIPNTIVSDNGPQFVSEAFKKFMVKWDIKHVTSSPRYPQSNGEAERAVQTAKGLMTKNLNFQAALCAYRDTPLANGFSPAQLLFGRGLNSLGYVKDSKIDLARLREFEGKQREKHTQWFNTRHRARERSPLGVNQPVVVREQGKTPIGARVVAVKGREVVAIGSNQQLLRRNRSAVSRQNEGGEPRDQQPLAERPLETSSPNRQRSLAQSGAVASESKTPPRSWSSVVRIGAEEKNTAQPAEAQPAAVSAERPGAVLRTRTGRVSKPPDRLNL